MVSRELHTARRLRELHFWTGCHVLLGGPSRITPSSLDPDQGRVEGKWSLDSDPDPHRIKIRGPVWKIPM